MTMEQFHMDLKIVDWICPTDSMAAFNSLRHHKVVASTSGFDTEPVWLCHFCSVRIDAVWCTLQAWTVTGSLLSDIEVVIQQLKVLCRNGCWEFVA